MFDPSTLETLGKLQQQDRLHDAQCRQLAATAHAHRRPTTSRTLLLQRLRRTLAVLAARRHARLSE